MPIRDRVITIFSRALVWQLGIAGLAVFAVLLFGILWVSGSSDTKEAMQDGRRLLITLSNGAIEGKQVSLENEENNHAATPVAKPEATAPAQASSPAAATRPAEATAPAGKPATQENTGIPASSPASASAPAESASADNAFDLMQNIQIKPATVPLAEVKESMLEKTADGNLPMIGPKNMRSWQYYGKPYAHKGRLPTIAVVVEGLGLNKATTEGALRLPENVSLSFSPYSHDIVSWAHAARTAGHEILLDLPLEPSNFPAADPGPEGLLTGKGVEENTRRLRWLMSRTEGYIGFTGSLNESFSSDNAAFGDLLEQLGNRGLMLTIAREPAKNDTMKILSATKTANITADAIIDEDLSATAIQARLLSLEKIASKRGFAVGIAQPYPITIQQLYAWTSKLEEDGFTLVPVSFIAKLKFPASS